MKKLFSLFLSFSLVLNIFGQVGLAWAYAKPTPPPKPTVPTAPTKPTPLPKPSKTVPSPTPTAVPTLTAPTSTPTPIASLTPTLPKKPKPHPHANSTNGANGSAIDKADGVLGVKSQGEKAESCNSNDLDAQNSGNGSNSQNSASTNATSDTVVSQKNDLKVTNDLNVEVDTGSNSANYSVGNAALTTGDANVGLNIANHGNQNTTAVGQAAEANCGTSVDCSGNGQGVAQAANSDNGYGSKNSATASNNQTSVVDTSNQAKVDNNFAVSNKTGNNQANYTTGGNASVTTGNSNTTLNVINFANTNGVEVAVKEFNVLDDQTDDVILDFSDAAMLNNQASPDGGAVNNENGEDSNNKASVDKDNTLIITNENQASTQNNIVVNADTGGNDANFTTGGGADIQTGDTNVALNVVNFLNNNLTAVGKVLVGVVNVFGDLAGNIVLPGSATNVNNGANSTNTAQTNLESSQVVVQSNAADIENNVTVNANTGGNETSYNTGGDVAVSTGNTSVDVATTTIANKNTVGSGDDETIFVVLVNEMGKWVGKVLGTGNQDNGVASKNRTTTSSSSQTTTDQKNTAAIQNDLVIDANTGENSTSYNTDGNSSVKTGDVNVLTNVVNFLNNNFVGKRIVLSVVNVFGSFVGDIGTQADFAAVQNNIQPTVQPAVSGPTLTSEPSKTQVNLYQTGQQNQSSQNEEPKNDNSASQPEDVSVLSPGSAVSPQEITDNNSTSPQNAKTSNADAAEEQSPVVAVKTSFSQGEVLSETAFNIAAQADSTEVKLAQKVSFQGRQKRTVQKNNRKLLVNKHTVSPWANRNLAPSVGSDVAFAGNQMGLPWALSSALLMAVGVVLGLIRKFLLG